MSEHGVIDEYVGKRLREKRILNGLSQNQLAEQLDVTFQQVQKYERGKNRISASRLFKCSLALKEPVSYFFQGLPGQEAEAKEALTLRDAAPGASLDREALEIIRMFYSIKDPALKQNLKALLKAISMQQE